jgi:hypothetical protein
MSGGSCNPLGVVIETRSMFNSCWSIHHAVYSPADYPDLSFKQFFGRATSICPGLVCGRCQYTNLAGIYAGNGNENAISWLNCPIVHSDSGELTILCFTFQFVKCDAPEGQVLPFSTSSQIFFLWSGQCPPLECFIFKSEWRHCFLFINDRMNAFAPLSGLNVIFTKYWDLKRYRWDTALGIERREYGKIG